MIILSKPRATAIIIIGPKKFNVPTIKTPGNLTNSYKLIFLEFTFVPNKNGKN